MAKKPWDDILKSVSKSLSTKTAQSAAKTVAKKAPAKKSAAKPTVGAMTKAERKAANQAKAAQERAARMKAGSEASAKRRAENKAKNSREYTARDQRGMESEWTRGTQIKKAREFFSEELDRSLKVSDATARVLIKGSGARRKFLERKINKMKEYAKDNGYTLSQSDIAAIVKDELRSVQKVNAANTKRTGQVVNQARFEKMPRTKGRKTGSKNPAEQETITTAARRQYRKDIKRGKAGNKSEEMAARDKQRQYDEQEISQRKTLVQANKKKLRDLPERKPRAKKEVKEQESSKRLRAAQEKNAVMSGSEYRRYQALSPAGKKRYDKSLTSKEAQKVLREARMAEKRIAKRRATKVEPNPKNVMGGRRWES
jgi:hypothetical protein